MPLDVKNTKDLKHYYGRWFFHGDSGVGKTRLAATWPKPLFLTCDTEGGILAVRDKAVDYHTVTDPETVMEALEELAVDADRGKCPYETVIIDSLTILQDNQLDILNDRRRDAVASKRKEKGKKDYAVDFYENVNLTEAEWNLIVTSLRSMFILAHSLPCHIIWIALSAREYSRVNRGEEPQLMSVTPMIYTRKAARKMPGVCDFVWYIDALTSRNKHVMRIQTTAYDKVLAKSRTAMSPMIQGTNITFKKLAREMSLVKPKA